MRLISNKDRKKICTAILNSSSITTYEYLYLERYSGLTISELGDKYPGHLKYVKSVENSKHYLIELKNPRCNPFLQFDDTVFKDDLNDKYEIFKEIEKQYMSKVN